MYPLWNLLKLIVGLAYRWATKPRPDAHPWGCHCERCMAEYLEPIKRRRREAGFTETGPLRPVEKRGSVSDADLLSALVNLGYKVKDAQGAINELGAGGAFEDRFKAALQLLRRT